jgi:hypothetical protein
MKRFVLIVAHFSRPTRSRLPFVRLLCVPDNVWVSGSAPCDPLESSASLGLRWQKRMLADGKQVLTGRGDTAAYGY